MVFENCDVAEVRPVAEQGLIVSNPPYGERLGDEMTLVPLYEALGAALPQPFSRLEAAF